MFFWFVQLHLNLIDNFVDGTGIVFYLPKFLDVFFFLFVRIVTWTGYGYTRRHGQCAACRADVIPCQGIYAERQSVAGSEKAEKKMLAGGLNIPIEHFTRIRISTLLKY